MSNAGYRYSTAAENIAQGQRTPAQVMNSWMNSPGHRANILNGNLRELGVGISSSNFYWTQAFATPQSACGNGFVEGSETCDTGDSGCAACTGCRLASGASCAARTELEAGQLCCTGGSVPNPSPPPPPPTTVRTTVRTPSPTPTPLPPGETPEPTPEPSPLPSGQTAAPDVCSDVVSCIGCVDMSLSPCKWCKYSAGATKCIPKGQTCAGQAISSLLVCDEKPAERKCTEINIASNKCSDCVQSDLDCQWCTSGRRCIDRSSAASATCPQGVVRDVAVCAQYDNELNGEETVSTETGIFITPDTPVDEGLPTWLIAVIAVLAVIVLCLVGAAIVMALISRKERKEADELRKWAEDTGSKPADFAPTTKGDAPPLLVRDHSTVAVAVATSKPLPPMSSGTFKPLPSSPSGTFKPLPAAPMPMPPASPRALPAYQDMQLNAPPPSFNVNSAPAPEVSTLDPFKTAAPIPGTGRTLPQLPPPTRRALPPPPAAPTPVQETATALYDFEGSQPGDLSLKEGDTIKLIDTSLSWWKGEVNGVIGSFPNNYAQKN
jgi:hypothetical protein